MLGPDDLPLDGTLSPYTGVGALPDRESIAKEVANGLPNEQNRLADALENQAFYDLESDRYNPRRQAENEFDYIARPQDERGFTQEVVDVLSEHQYTPGPARSVLGGGPAHDLLMQVYEQCHIDAVMQRAEALSTLNDVAAIEVRATNDPDRPIDLHLWGADEFAVFVDPDDPRKPLAVVTIDRVNQQTRYRLWFPDVVRTFLTKPWTTSTTAGSRVAYEQAPEPNTYGCLPFAFVHYRMPVHRFWTPGIGTFLRKAELRVNVNISDLDEAFAKYLCPIGIFKNVPSDYNPEVGRGRFLRLVSAETGYTGEGYTPAADPSAEYLQATVDAAGVWTHIGAIMDGALEAARVPRAAVRMEQTGITSGIALVVEQEPLIRRARQRRPAFVYFENELAKTILRVHGGHYDHPEHIETAKTLRLILAWPEIQISIPGPDRDATDEWELAQGILSRVELVMRRRGFTTREQAIDYLKQVKKDNDEADKIDPPDPPAPMPVDGKNPVADPPGPKPEPEPEPDDEDNDND